MIKHVFGSSQGAGTEHTLLIIPLDHVHELACLQRACPFILLLNTICFQVFCLSY